VVAVFGLDDPCALEDRRCGLVHVPSVAIACCPTPAD
jgi:hypothetical protein